METQCWQSNMQQPSWFPSEKTQVNSEYFMRLSREINNLLHEAKTYRAEALERLYLSSLTSAESIYRLRQRQPNHLSKSSTKSHLLKQKTQLSPATSKLKAESKRNGTEVDEADKTETAQCDLVQPSSSFNITGKSGKRIDLVLPNSSSAHTNFRIPNVEKKEEVFVNLMYTTNEINRRISEGFNYLQDNNPSSQTKSIIRNVSGKTKNKENDLKPEKKRSQTYTNECSSKTKSRYREQVMRKMKRTNRRTSKSSWQSYFTQVSHCSSSQSKLKLLETERKTTKHEILFSKSKEINKINLKKPSSNNSFDLQDDTSSSDSNSDASNKEKDEKKKADCAYEKKESNRHMYKKNLRTYFNRMLIKYSSQCRTNINKINKRIKRSQKVVSQIKDNNKPILNNKSRIINIGKCGDTIPDISTSQNQSSLPNIEKTKMPVPKILQNCSSSDTESNISNINKTKKTSHELVSKSKEINKVIMKTKSQTSFNSLSSDLSSQPKINGISKSKLKISNIREISRNRPKSCILYSEKKKLENGDSIPEAPTMPKLNILSQGWSSKRPKSSFSNIKERAKNNQDLPKLNSRPFSATFSNMVSKNGSTMRPKSSILYIENKAKSKRKISLMPKLNSTANKSEAYCTRLPSAASCVRAKPAIVNVENIEENIDDSIHDTSLMPKLNCAINNSETKNPLKGGSFARPISNLEERAAKKEDSIVETTLMPKCIYRKKAETHCNILSEDISSTRPKLGILNIPEVAAKNEDSIKETKLIPKQKKYLEIYRNVLSMDDSSKVSSSMVPKSGILNIEKQSDKCEDSKKKTKQKTVILNVDKKAENNEDSKKETNMMPKVNFKNNWEIYRNASSKCSFSTKHLMQRRNCKRSSATTYSPLPPDSFSTKIQLNISKIEEKSKRSKTSTKEMKLTPKGNSKSCSDKKTTSNTATSEQSAEEDINRELMKKTNLKSSQTDVNISSQDCYATKPISDTFNIERNTNKRQVLTPKSTLMDRPIFKWNNKPKYKYPPKNLSTLPSSNNQSLETKTKRDLSYTSELNEQKLSIKTDEKQNGKTSYSQTDFITFARSCPTTHPDVNHGSGSVIVQCMKPSQKTKRMNSFDYVYTRTNCQATKNRDVNHVTSALIKQRNAIHNKRLSVSFVPIAGRSLLTNQYVRVTHVKNVFGYIKTKQCFC